MGYYMDQMEAKFKFKDGKDKEILTTIKKIVNEGKIDPYVDKDTINDCKTFEDALLIFDWEYADYDNGENVVPYIFFVGEISGDDYRLFRAIAPFVEDNSYIQMLGEDGAMWRWVFKDGKCREIHPKIIWEV